MAAGTDPDTEALPSFDEAIYLQAFPDVAMAIEAGICESPLQHYLEHGQNEDRLSHEHYLALLRGRELEGFVDSYGYSEHAGGWLFCGWVAAPWDVTCVSRLIAQFHGGTIAGQSITVFHERPGLEGRGTGLVLFITGRADSLGPLLRLDLLVSGERLTLPVMTEAPRLADAELVTAMRAILIAHQDVPNCRDLLMLLLSTTGYGRLPAGLNRLDGFIDFYGYHAASGGWYLCGWTTRSWEPEDEPDEVLLHFGDTHFACQEVVAGFYQRDDLQGRGVGCVLFVRGSGRPLSPLGSVELRSAGIASHARASSSSQRLRDTELVGRLRSILAPIAESEGGAELLALLARQPYLGVDTLASLSDPIALEFDEVIACPPSGIVLMGWMLAKPNVIRSIRLRSAQLDAEVDLDAFIKVERPDVIEALGAERGFFDTRCGFITYVPAEIPPAAPLHIEVETARREVGYRKLPASKLDGVAAMKRMLGTFDVRYNDVPLTYDRIIGPAVEQLNVRRLATPPKADEVVFGEVNPAPRFSIIIPLYGRLDFVEYQMAFFSTYAPAFDYEFIYVLDDPPKRREALRLFDATYNRFGIPFRAVLMEQNMGFAPANNVGLRYARGTYLCFLNSDVFPGTPDWLERLATRLEANPQLGAVGPMLLYGDGTVQHEGMTFKPLSEFGGWYFGDHPRKGMRKSGVTGLRKHISITGACMLMRLDLAKELGGFDESFVIGDFEDSDLCLRLLERGLDSAVDLDVELFHLERKSQVSAAQNWRMNMTLYNAWLHQKRWGDVIAEHPLAFEAKRGLPTRGSR